MNLERFRDMLLTVTEYVGHGMHFKNQNSYLVWQEVGTIGLRAENEKTENGYRIAVDYFTKLEYDMTPNLIETLFGCNEIAADDAVIDFEPDTGYTHYAWTCE